MKTMKWQTTSDIEELKTNLKTKQKGGTKTEAMRRMRELESGLDKGVPIPVGKLTVAEHLRNWLEGYVRTTCSPRMVEGYESIVENHMIPALGHIQLRQLQPQTIQAYYGKACEKLSGRLVQHHHRVLAQSLKNAVRLGTLGRNPADLFSLTSLLEYLCIMQ